MQQVSALVPHSFAAIVPVSGSECKLELDTMDMILFTIITLTIDQVQDLPPALELKLTICRAWDLTVFKSSEIPLFSNWCIAGSYPVLILSSVHWMNAWISICWEMTKMT